MSVQTCPTFLPSIESTPLCSYLGVGLLGEGAEGQPNSLCSVWVVWVCARLSSDPDSLLKKKQSVIHKTPADIHFSLSQKSTSIINVEEIAR